jgi:hypothetical protein
MKLKSKAIVVLVATICLLFPANRLAIAQFKDIQGHWAEPQISYWLNKGIVKGYPDGTFAPHNSITRAEFITLINKMLGFNDTEQVAFNDVSSTDWFYEEVSKARAAGYITGYEDNSLRPGNPIKREEVAVVISRLVDIKAGNDSVHFKDSGSVSSWARPGVFKVVDNNLMKGYPDLTFKPLNYITRAEALITLDNVFWFKHPVIITPMGSGLDY